METTIKQKKAKLSEWDQKCSIFEEFQWTSILSNFSANINNWKSDPEHPKNHIDECTYLYDLSRAKVVHLLFLMSKKRVHVSDEGNSYGKTSISQQSNRNTKEMTPSIDTPHLPDGMGANNLVDCYDSCVVIHKIRHKWGSAIVICSEFLTSDGRGSGILDFMNQSWGEVRDDATKRGSIRRRKRWGGWGVRKCVVVCWSHYCVTSLYQCWYIRVRYEILGIL
jgi:hypothetical protein